MMYFAVVSSKGQVTLPKELRERLSLKPGDELLYTLMGDGVLMTPKSTDFNDLAGLLGVPPKGRATLKEIENAIADEASQGAVMPLRRASIDDAA